MERHPVDGMGASIRRARAGDEGAIARLIIESWRSSYAGIIPADYLLGMSHAVIAARWRAAIASQGVFVAVDAEEAPVGVGFCGARRSSDHAFEGEIFALYVADDAKGRGLGRALMAAMAVHLLDHGIERAFLWCLRDNPSRWFYERMGGRFIAERIEAFAGTRLAEVAYGWDDLRALTREPPAGD
jgi:GNAT superfamily N-acetyltransferase